MSLRPNREISKLLDRASNFLLRKVIPQSRIHALAAHLMMSTNAIKKVLQFKWALERDVEGDIVECGVGYGRTLLIIHELVKYLGLKKHIWGFDSFQGFPPPTAEDLSLRNPRAGEFSCSLSSVKGYLKNVGLTEKELEEDITLVPGFFPDSFRAVNVRKISFLNLDVDLYQSYKSCLEEFYEKLSPGGVIIFDEYKNEIEARNFPGASRAIDDFFDQHGIKNAVVKDCNFWKYYHIKGIR